MCKCINVDFGTYENQIMVDAPQFMLPLINCIGEEKEPYICLDKCIADEVMNLWSKKIHTVGCCCGHNKIDGYIQVKHAYIDDMIKLGYKFTNKLYGNCFKTKTKYKL